jgi:hypothetical protein
VTVAKMIAERHRRTTPRGDRYRGCVIRDRRFRAELQTSSTVGGGSGNLLPLANGDRPSLTTASIYSPPIGDRCASDAQSGNTRGFRLRRTSDANFLKEKWRRRPDLNRGWRFCRFNGVMNRVVSCWSLVCPAPPFCLVLGPYWTTSGLQVHSEARRPERPHDVTQQPPFVVIRRDGHSHANWQPFAGWCGSRPEPSPG